MKGGVKEGNQRGQRGTADHRDYSGTPLRKKLGISEGARVYVVAPPETFEEALETVAPLPAGVTFLRRPGADVDFATVQAIGLAAGLVDHKSGSMTDGYQGLQFVYRLKDRAG